MNVYTYFEHVPELPKDDELKLIDLWKESWKKHGWNPVVLGPPENPSEEWKRLENRITTYPNVNAKRYEMACMLRWVALKEVGGGLMVDYDVMNYGYTPDNLYKNSHILNLGKCPCAVYADVDACGRIIEAIYHFDLNKAGDYNGIRFVHDQVVVRAEWDKLGLFELGGLCYEPKDLPTIDHDPKLVHYTNEWSYVENKRPRWQHISI